MIIISQGKDFFKMKKITSLFLVSALFTIMATCVLAADNTVDLSALEMNEPGGQGNGLYPSWTDGGYPENTPVITFMQYGAFVNLGKIDLSKYSAVTVRYGQHSGEGKGFGDGTFIAISDAPVQNTDGTAVENSKIIAKIVPVVTDKDGVSWKDTSQTVSAALNAENFTQGQSVYISVFLDTAKSNGISIDEITFTESAANNPSTSDTLFALAAFVAITSFGAITLLRKNRIR